MKRTILLLFVLSLFLSTHCQTGSGWLPYRNKMNVLDSSYFAKDVRMNSTLRVREGYFRIGAVLITANGNEINTALDGILVTASELNSTMNITGNIQTQLNAKAAIDNPNFTNYPRRSSDTLSTRIESRTYAARAARDTVADLIARSGTAHDYVPYWSDTTHVTGKIIGRGEFNEAIANAGSGGGNYSIYHKEFDVGDSGFPAEGDSIFTSSQWTGLVMVVQRNGAALRLRPTGDNRNGFRFDNLTGKITVIPPFVDQEEVIVNGYTPAAIIDVTLEGEEEETFADDFRAFWRFNEASGTSLADIKGTYNATTNATVAVTGRFGYGVRFDGVDDFANAGTTVQDIGTSDFFVTAHIYPTNYGTGYNIGGIIGCWGDYPYFYIGLDAYTQRIIAVVNFAGSNIEILSNSAVSLNTWTHVGVNFDRDGNMVMYINGTAQSETASIAAHSSVSLVNNNTMAIGQIGTTYSGYNFTGTIDEPGILPRLATPTEITTLSTSSLP